MMIINIMMMMMMTMMMMMILLVHVQVVGCLVILDPS